MRKNPWEFGLPPSALEEIINSAGQSSKPPGLHIAMALYELHAHPRQTLKDPNVPSVYEIALQQRARGEYPFDKKSIQKLLKLKFSGSKSEYPFDEKGVLIYHGIDPRFTECANKGILVYHLNKGIGMIEFVENGSVSINIDGKTQKFEINSQGSLNERIWGLPADDFEKKAKSMLDAPIPAELQEKINNLADDKKELYGLLVYAQKRLPGYYRALEIVAGLYKEIESVLDLREATKINLLALSAIGVVARDSAGTRDPVWRNVSNYPRTIEYRLNLKIIAAK